VNHELWQEKLMIIPNTQNIEVIVFDVDKVNRGNIASASYPVIAWSIGDGLDIKPVTVVKLSDKPWCYTLSGTCIFSDGSVFPDIHAALKYVRERSRFDAMARR